MAEVGIYIAETDVKVDSNKVLGFFGQNGFNDPLSLGEFNGRTFLTNTSGSVIYEEADNCKKTSPSGVVIGQIGNTIQLNKLPNYLATINIRFTHPSPVLVSNITMVAYDGANINNAPIGVDVYGAQIVHTDKLQSSIGASDPVWTKMDGSINPILLVNSPGTSGFSPLGGATFDTRHDWYCALSVSPNLPGDKIFTFKIDLEFI